MKTAVFEDQRSLGLTVKVFRRIEEIPREDWEAVYPNVLEGYDFFKSFEETSLEQFSYYYLMVYENRTLIGAAPAFLMNYSIDTTLQGFWKKFLVPFKKAFPGLFNLKVLICGHPIGLGRIGFTGDGNRVVAAIRDCLENIAKIEKTLVIAFKEFAAKDEPLLRVLERTGYYRFESVPNTVKTLSFKNFDDYLMSLSYATRYDLKRKFKKVDGQVPIQLEIKDSLGDDLEEAHALYLQMITRHDLSLETTPKEFFQKIAENMPGKAKFFLWRLEGKLVAFAFCLVSGDYFLDYYLGLDYSVAYDYHLYFVRFRDLMRWCLANGMNTYEMGCTNYDPKKRLDFKFVPQNIYVKLRDAWLNRLTPFICELIKPVNFDPVLKKIAKEKKGPKKRLSVNLIFLILTVEVIDALAQILMKKGLGSSPHFLWAGLFVYAMNFFAWILILAKLDLSLAVPLTSINYVVIPILTMFFLHEKIGPSRWTGIFLIVFGVIIICKNEFSGKKRGPA